MLHCFSRLTETDNQFENKSICLKIAEVLLSFGADINARCMGRTILMKFCAVRMQLDPLMLRNNLDAI